MDLARGGGLMRFVREREKEISDLEDNRALVLTEDELRMIAQEAKQQPTEHQEFDLKM
jgi:hypothetical protein